MKSEKLLKRCIWGKLAVLFILAGLFIAPVTGLSTRGWAAPTAPLPLVQVNLDNRSQLPELSALNLSVYLQLDRPDGGMLVLLPADAELQETLKNQGYALQIVDADSSQGSYYLIDYQDMPLAQAQAHIAPLAQQGSQVVLRMDPSDAAQLSAAGARLTPLALHPLVIPRETDSMALPQAISADPLIQRMVDRVSRDTLYQSVGGLSGEWPVTVNGDPYQFFTRYTMEYQPITKATRFAHDHFASLGLLADYHYYTISGLERRNVLAQQTGLAQPNRIFLLIAHLDSTSQTPATLAPGADDNASGSAAVMHISEILEPYPFGCTLRYVLFTGEEQGLYGSWAYANQLNNAGVNVVAVLNLDMIAYSRAGSAPGIELHTRHSNETDLEIAGLFDAAVDAYQLDLIPSILRDNLSFSDHYPFWQNGYPGILAIEDWSDHTPFYHTTNDRLSTLNMDFYTEFTKAALATYAHMGCLLQGRLAGTVRDSANGMPVPGAVVTVQAEGDTPWVASTLADGSYQLPLYAGDYTVTISASGYQETIPVETQILHDTTTTLDFDLLAPWTSFIYLPLIGTGVP